MNLPPNKIKQFLQQGPSWWEEIIRYFIERQFSIQQQKEFKRFVRLICVSISISNSAATDSTLTKFTAVTTLWVASADFFDLCNNNLFLTGDFRELVRVSLLRQKRVGTRARVPVAQAGENSCVCYCGTSRRELVRVLLRHKRAGTRALVTAAQACDGTIAMNWLVNGDHRKKYSSIVAPGDF